MRSRKISLIISILILLIVIGAIIYYLWPQKEQEEVDLFEFKVLTKDLDNQLIERYANQFDLVKQAIEKNPDYLNAWLQLGMIKKTIGDYRGAEKAWVKAGEIRPKNSTSFGNLADLYANFLQDYDKAIIAYQTAITNSEGEAKNASFYRNFYYFYLYNLGDKTKAEQTLLEGIENNPASSELVVLLASFYQDEGNVSKAIEYYEKALALDPKDEVVEEELEKLK